jgi:hypothetical protein
VAKEDAMSDGAVFLRLPYLWSYAGRNNTVTPAFSSLDT